MVRMVLVLPVVAAADGWRCIIKLWRGFRNHQSLHRPGFVEVLVISMVHRERFMSNDQTLMIQLFWLSKGVGMFLQKWESMKLLVMGFPFGMKMKFYCLMVQ